MFRSVVVFLAVACAFGAAKVYDPNLWHATDGKIGSVEECNEFVDNLLEKVTVEKYEEIEPYEAEPYNKTIPYNLLFVSGEIVARLYDTRVHGLSSIQRVGDCKFVNIQGTSGGAIPLSIGTLEGTSSGEVKVDGKGPEVTTKCTVGESKAEMFVVIKEDKPFILWIKLKTVSSLKASIEGLGYLSWALNIMSTAMTTMYREIIKLIIEGKLVWFFNQQI